MIRGVVASGRRRGGVPVQIILTAGTSWTVPADWNSANNKVECVGAGAKRESSTTGGGGGAYARKNNLTLTPGANVGYQIGVVTTDGTFAATWLVDTATVLAAGAISSNPGSSSACVGDVAYSGGGAGGYGGGGAAGPNGAGIASSGSTGGAGDAGFGGVGGISGESGGDGTEWGAAGSGGGAGRNGGFGGLYGGGGGSGSGARGVIVITYTPA